MKNTTTTTTAPPPTLAELEAAVLAGDTTIGAGDLEAARARQRHAELVAEGEAHRVHLAAQAAHEAEVARLREKILTLADDRPELLARVHDLSAALAALLDTTQGRAVALDALAREARSLDVAQMSLDGVPRDPSGVGWRIDIQQAGPARLRVDDLVLAAADPRTLIARVVKDALDRARMLTTGFSLANAGESAVDQVDATVRHVVPMPTRRVRVVKRWGDRPAGVVVEVDAESAAWARAKGYAVPA